MLAVLENKNNYTISRSAKRTGKRGTPERVVEEEKLTPVSRTATVVATYFTGTSGLASHAGEHNSSGVTRMSLFPVTSNTFQRTSHGRWKWEEVTLPLFMVLRDRTFRFGGGGAPCTENGFCQGVTELFIYEIEHTG